MSKFSKLNKFTNIEITIYIIFVIIIIIIHYNLIAIIITRVCNINEEEEKNVKKINKSWKFCYDKLLKTYETIASLNHD